MLLAKSNKNVSKKMLLGCLSLLLTTSLVFHPFKYR